MPATLLVKKVTNCFNVDGLQKAGDYYFVGEFGTMDAKSRPRQALIMKCPFCARDMVTTTAHKIEFKKGILDFIFGYDGKINISTMLQCPYTSTHQFTIKKGKVKEYLI